LDFLLRDRAGTPRVTSLGHHAIQNGGKFKNFFLKVVIKNAFFQSF
jgi:hypothetical protein